MKKRIARISTYAIKVLDNNKNGKVHSVYRKTINICFGTQLIALQVKGTQLSPLSIIIDTNEKDFRLLNIKVGDDVQVTLSEILICGISFYKKNSEIIELNINERITSQSRKFFLNESTLIYDGILELLKEKEVLDLFFLRDKAMSQTMISLYAEKNIHEFYESISNAEDDKAAEKIVQLVGLGKGLTPSGDDFICGMLAGMTFCTKEEKERKLLYQIKNYTAEALERTNDISSAFLKCAIEGYYSEAIFKLPLQDNSVKIASLFSDIGHSSGADTLCGIFFGIQTLNYYSNSGKPNA